MGRWSSTERQRFRYTYTDNGGVTTKQVVDTARLNALWGPWMFEVVSRDDFRRVTIEVGRRKAVVERA